MAVTSEPVEILIKVTDGNSGEVIGGVEKRLNSMGAAGATTGAKASAAMTGMAGSARGAEGAFRKLAEATAELNFVQGRNREILTALRKGEVSAAQAMVDLTESMEEQTAAATALAEAKAALSSQDAKLSGRESYGAARIGMSAMTGSFSGMGMGLAQIISSNEKLAGLWNAALPLAMAAGMVGILVDVGHELYNIYERWFDVNAATKKYNDELEKTRQQDFGNTRSIEDTTLRIQQATNALKEWQQYKESQNEEGGSLWSGLLPGGLLHTTNTLTHRYLANRADAHIVDQEKAIRALAGSANEQAHQQARDQIQLNHALDGELQGRAKILMTLAKQKSLNQENQDFERRQATLSGNPVSQNFGESERKLKDNIAEKEAQAELFKLRREQTQEVMHLQNEATNAELHGIALLEAQRKQALDELKFKGIATAEAVGAVNRKFNAEEKKFLADELQATKLIQEQASMSGLTGIAKIQAQGHLDIDRINGDSNLTESAKAARVASAQKTTQSQIVEAQRQFSQQIDRIVDQSTAHQLTGFARINAEEKHQLDDLKKKFDETYGQLNHASPAYQRGQSDLQRGQAAIRQDSDEQSQDLAQRNAEETAQIEAQARIRSLSAEKQKTAAIEAEYEERTRKLMEQLQQQEIGWDDYNRRVAAAGEQRDAEMVQAATEAREKMAREFDSVFRNLDHPLRMLQEMGARAAAQAAANMVSRYQMRHQHAQTAIATGNPVDFLGSIFGHKHGATGAGHVLTASASTHEIGGQSMAISAAQIQIGTAQIAFGGGSSSSSDFLGGTGLSSSGGAITGIPTAATSSGIGFSPSTSRVVGGGFSSANELGNFLFGGGAGGGATPQAPAHTSGGVMPSSPGGGGVVSALQQGVGVTQTALGLFGKHASAGTGILQPTDKDVGDGTLNADGSYTSASSGAGMLNGGGFAANAMGAGGGVLGLYSAYQGNGGFGGAASGAMSGMELGMALGGPVGAAVGAAAGAIVGAIGFGGREKARVYDLKNVRPRIQTDQLAYNTGSMDYSSAYSDLQSLDVEAKHTTNKMGPAAESYYKDTIEPEIHKAIQRFNNEEKAGRSQYTASAAMYDVGSDFVPRTGMAVIHRGERIMPSDQNERITQAIEGGSMMPADSGGDVHLHVHAIDAKSSIQFLMANKNAVRSALNASYAENSGGSDA